MVYVEEARSTIKGGVAVKLTSKTILCGPNGAGKSAIVNAVELALTGRASDIAGRVEVAREADLAALAPGGLVEAEVRLSDGRTVKWVGGKGHRGSQPAHPDAFPLRAVREAVLGSPETARRFFLHQAGGSVSMADILPRIPLSLNAAWQQADRRGRVGEDDPPVDRLLGALRVASEQARSFGAQSKAARTVSSQVGQGAPPATSTEIEAARQEVDGAAAALQAAAGNLARRERYVSAQQRLRAIEMQIDACAGERAAAEARRAVLQAELAALAEPASEDQLAALRVLRFHVDRGLTDCAVCGNAVDTERLRAARTYAEGRMALRVRAREQRAELERDLNQVESILENIALDEESLATELAEAKLVLVAGKPEEGADAASAQARLAAAETRLATLLGSQERWESVRKAQDAAIHAERQAGEWKQLAEVLSEVVKALLETCVRQFAERVQSYLPRSDVFALRLTDGEREVCQFGLVREGGVLHTALSGAEWARVTAAIAMACVKDDGPTVIVPEERAFDPKTLTEVLRGFTRAPAQVLVTSPVEPEELPDGWTLIRVDALKKGEVEELPIFASEAIEVAPPAKPGLLIEDKSSLPLEPTTPPKRRSRRKASQPAAPASEPEANGGDGPPEPAPSGMAKLFGE